MEVIKINFLNFLKSDKNSRKIFGKSELKIVEKQLLGINLTQSEKNRLSRDIRPKFSFIAEAFKYSDLFDLKKASIIKKIIEETRDIILSDSIFKKIKEIILFGSVVEKKLTFKSDIDVAVKFDKISLKEATLFRKRILGEVNQKVDIQAYNYLPKKIRKEVDRGRILYKK